MKLNNAKKRANKYTAAPTKFLYVNTNKPQRVERDQRINISHSKRSEWFNFFLQAFFFTYYSFLNVFICSKYWFLHHFLLLLFHKSLNMTYQVKKLIFILMRGTEENENKSLSNRIFCWFVERKTLNPDHSEPATHKISSITIALASASANNIISIAISQKSQPWTTNMLYFVSCFFSLLIRNFDWKIFIQKCGRLTDIQWAFGIWFGSLCTFKI